MTTEYKLILGLETHVELKTEQKMFCGCSTKYFGTEPNSHTCPVCLGLPGALPVPNFKAIQSTILIGLAFNCEINETSLFERKHYFYSDLAKGYQISQYQKPLCHNGWILVNHKKIRINRIHIEEDTGKLIHGAQMNDPNSSFIDFNRSGVPLVEIVTEPDFDSADDAALYLKKLQLIIQYLGVSDADMEKGSMRCEPNISVIDKNIWDKEHLLPSFKVEVKNINSFRFVKNSVESEKKRQIEMLETKKIPIQETRRYVESTGKTESMRSKEDAKDYRYFPEPDIPPMAFTKKQISEMAEKLETKELPEKRSAKLINTLKVRKDLAETLVSEKWLGDIFFELYKKVDDLNKLTAFLVNQRKNIIGKTATDILELYQKANFKKTVSTAMIQKTIKEILLKNPKAVADYRSGKINVLQFLLGNSIRILGREVDSSLIMLELKKQLG